MRAADGARDADVVLDPAPPPLHRLEDELRMTAPLSAQRRPSGGSGSGAPRCGSRSRGTAIADEDVGAEAEQETRARRARAPR
jgi:hypothetical protein